MDIETTTPTPPTTAGLRRWVAERPVGAFFVFTYLYSWLLWSPAALGFGGAAGEALIFVGVWGPAAAGATVTWLLGRPVKDWIRSMLRWRIPRRWYAAALLFPAAVVAFVSLAFVVLGEDLDSSLLGERLAIYVPMLVFLTLLGGGNEEWGWRGFALRGLLERHRPVTATLILGSLWALWHLPLLAAQDDLSHGLGGAELTLVLTATVVNIIGLAFFYTYLYRMTRSVVLAVVFHGSFNAANGALVLREEIEGNAYATMQYCITATTLALVAALIWFTRGQLGPDGRSHPGRPHLQPRQDPPGHEAARSMNAQQPPSHVQDSTVDLYWIPLGAGNPVVEASGRIYERVSAWRHNRTAHDLYHAALVLGIDGARLVVEQAPVPDGSGSDRGVVATGPVGVRAAGRFRIFRYEIRCWPNGIIPDLTYAVDSPVSLSRHPEDAETIVRVLAAVPTPVWGRDEARAGEMWNSNSVIAWVLTRSGLDPDTLDPPPGGRAPGWTAGQVVAERGHAASDAGTRSPA